MFVFITKPTGSPPHKGVGGRAFIGNISFEKTILYTSTNVESETTMSTGDLSNLFVEILPNRYDVRNKFLERRPRFEDSNTTKTKLYHSENRTLSDRKMDVEIRSTSNKDIYYPLSPYVVKKKKDTPLD